MCFKSLTLFFLLLVVYLAPAAWAQDTENKAGHLTGRVEAGLLCQSTNDQLLAAEENKHHKHSKDEGDNTTTFNIPLLFELRYGFKSQKTSIYAETPSETLGGALRLGLTHNFHQDGDILDVALFFEPDIVWKNPYESENPREDTPIYKAGLDLNYEKIGGTPISIAYQVHWEDVDKDLIGEQLPLLRRDGYIQKFGFTYTIPCNPLNTITPGFTFTRCNLDGRSNSYRGFRGELVYQREKADYGIYTIVAVDHNSYDAIHLLYMNERAEDIYSGGLIVTFYKTFGNRNAFTRFGLGYEYANANIDFFDYQTIACGFTIGYFF